MTAVLEARSVAGGYGDIEVVQDVSLRATPGRITALLGRNGAGKTTTLRLIAGLNRLRRGQLLLDGTDISRLPAHLRVGAGIGYVQEGKRVFRERTVHENLLLGAYSRRLSRAELTTLAEEAYERFPALAAKRTVPAGLLSGGQQQMLAIAQALAARPRVLLLDEPTTGLAPAIVEDLFTLIRRLRTEGLAVVLVEQVLDFTLEVADDAMIVNLGRTVHAGPASDAELRRVAEATYLGAELV